MTNKYNIAYIANNILSIFKALFWEGGDVDGYEMMSG
jgi:hypothetical protein